LPVPAALRGVVASDLLHFAVLTNTGRTVCIDTSWVETAEDLSLTADGRFVSFGWLGYETYGHTLVDRAGGGHEIETGVAPTFSPSRRLFAAADQTESEFGSLTGLAVWRVGKRKTTEVGRIGEVPGMYDLKIERWLGEACIELSGIEQDLPPEVIEEAPRVRFRAEPADEGWRVVRDDDGCGAPRDR
jgi:hypothetical protein